MNGIKNGEIKFIASTTNNTNYFIIFNDNSTIFSSLNNNDISIIGYNGIYIYKNIIYSYNNNYYSITNSSLP